MTNNIAALPPATQPIRHEADHDGLPDTKELAFDEIWQDPDKGLSFGDILDIVNPLQHIPIVSTLYRMITGDEISQGARMIGGAVYGGPVGLLGAGLVAAFEEASGGSVETHVASLFSDDSEDPGATAGGPGEAQLAAVTPTMAVSSPAAPTQPAAAALPAMPALSEAQLARLTGIAPAAGSRIGSPAFPAKPDMAAHPSNAPATPVLPAAHPVVLEKVMPAAGVPEASPPATGEKTGKGADAAEAARDRIAREIAQAQRAQAGLLIASLQADGAAAALTASGDDRSKTASSATAAGATSASPLPALPFRSHPYMLPRGAPAHMVADSMERALQRYHRNLPQQSMPAHAAR